MQGYCKSNTLWSVQLLLYGYFTTVWNFFALFRFPPVANQFKDFDRFFLGFINFPTDATEVLLQTLKCICTLENLKFSQIKNTSPEKVRPVNDFLLAMI